MKLQFRVLLTCHHFGLYKDCAIVNNLGAEYTWYWISGIYCALSKPCCTILCFCVQGKQDKL